MPTDPSAEARQAAREWHEEDWTGRAMHARWDYCPLCDSAARLLDRHAASVLREAARDLFCPDDCSERPVDSCVDKINAKADALDPPGRERGQGAGEAEEVLDE